MKQAFLITAYKDFEFLLDLATRLSKIGYVFIHIDKKSALHTSEHLEKLNALERCDAIATYEIVWGGYHHVQAMFDLLEKAVKNPDISYIHCITGEDYPVISLENMKLKYDDCMDIFLDYVEPEDLNEVVKKRFYYYNLFQDWNVKNSIVWQMQNFTVLLQKVMGIKRIGIGEFTHIYKGLFYISLPKDAAEYILDYCKNHDEFLKDLKRCQIPEEFLFQTLFMNSKFSERIIKKELRFMNWEKGTGGSPAYLDEEDFDSIIQSGCTFARKFHPIYSKQLLKKIKEITE